MGASVHSPLERHPDASLPVLLPPLTVAQRRRLERQVLLDAADEAESQARATAYAGHLHPGQRLTWETLAAIALWLRDRANQMTVPYGQGDDFSSGKG